MTKLSAQEFTKMISDVAEENSGGLPTQEQWNKIIFNLSKVDMSNSVNYDIIIEKVSSDIYDFISTKNPLVYAFLKSNNIGFDDIKEQLRKIIKGE